MAGDARRRRRAGPGPAAGAAELASTRSCSPTSPRWPPGAAGRAGPRSTCSSASPVWRPPTRRCRRGRPRLPACTPAAADGGQASDLFVGGKHRQPAAAVLCGLDAALASSPCSSCGATLLSSGAWRRRGATAPGPAGRGPRRRPGRRDPAAAGAAPAVLVDGGPPGDDLAAQAARRRRRAPRRRRSSPTTSPITPAGSRSCSAGSRSPARLRAPRAARLRAARARRRRAPRCGSPRAARSALRRGCASRCSGRRPSCSPKPQRRRRPEPAGAGPARPLARLLDAADRRCRGGGGADRPGPGRRAQGRPPRQRRRRPRRPCSIASGRGWR